MMKKISIIIFCSIALTFACKQKEKISVSSGVNTSRSNIKNNMEITDTTKVIKEEKK